MKGLAGCRSYTVLNNVTSGTLGSQYIYVEVTNNNASDVVFYANDFPMQGHPANGIPECGIPIKAGTTREIPLQVCNFTASGAVTVVAYMQ